MSNNFLGWLLFGMALFFCACGLSATADEVQALPDEEHMRRVDFRPSEQERATLSLITLGLLVVVLGCFIALIAGALYFGWFGGLE